MVVCKFFLAGRCRYGKDCKFEHITPPSTKPANGDADDHAPAHVHAHAHAHAHSDKPHNSRPLWPLTVVAIEENHRSGNVSGHDISPEELRAMAYEIAPRGQGPKVTEKEAQVVATHCPQVQNDKLHHDTLLQQQNQPSIPSDPFRYSDAPNQNESTGASFGMEVTSNPFSNPLQNNNNPTNFGAPPNNDAFHPNQGQPIQLPNPIQPQHNSNPDPQFSSPQFTFENVPETAPLPQFY